MGYHCSQTDSATDADRVNGEKNTIAISKEVKEVVLGVAGDSRVMEVTHVDIKGRSREDFLKVSLEGRAQGSRMGFQTPLH